jgi:ABC-type transporter Mla maintaining outer membrane lipid asymmetry ATPase subunit MlaF
VDTSFAGSAFVTTNPLDDAETLRIEVTARIIDNEPHLELSPAFQKHIIYLISALHEVTVSKNISISHDLTLFYEIIDLFIVDIPQ